METSYVYDIGGGDCGMYMSVVLWLLFSGQANRMLVRVWSDKLKASHPSVSIVSCHLGVTMSNVWVGMWFVSTHLAFGHGESETLYFCVFVFTTKRCYMTGTT
jgi:hypothetical protein